MKILVLCEGDAETNDSWSGISKNVVQNLRLLGHEVVTGDVDLYGVSRWIAAASTWRPNRRRWWTRYHLGAVPFLLRSRNASRSLRTLGANADVILQFGATFRVPDGVDTPLVYYGDSNIRLSEHGQDTGYSEAAVLTSAEIEAVARREGAIYGRMSRIFTISERLRRSFIEDFQIPVDRIQTIHAGPNIDVAQVPWPRRRRSDTPPTVLFVGRQFHRKGGDLILEAFREVREKVADARLLIVGPQDLVVDDPGVEVLGFLQKDTEEGRQRLAHAYSDASVFCLPTRFEAFGIVYLEAMCFGLPCIGPDAWAVPEIVADGVTGYVTPPNDAAAIAERLIELLNDSELAQRMGDEGRARALEHFTWPATIGRMVEGLKEVTPMALTRG